MRFSDIEGHTELKRKLVQNYKSDRVPHAQLYLGDEGSNNLSLAIATIQLLFCDSPTEDDSCGECSSCVKISRQIHPDVHFSYPTAGAKQVSSLYIEEWRSMLTENSLFNVSDWMTKIAKDENKNPNITKEESREILSKLSLKPFEGKAKALIVWMPEYLENVGNSLLKIIEEPPQKTYFILVANQFDRLLSTITSRTQLVKVPSYTDNEVVNFLKEKYHLESNQAENLAFLAEGNLRNAYTMVEDVDDDYSEKFRTLMLACYKNDLNTGSQLVDDLAKLGRGQIQLFLINGLKILRETLLFKHIEDYEIRFAGEYKDFIKNFAKTLNAKLIEDSYKEINDTIYHIGRNANAKISLFNLSLSLRHNFLRSK